MADIGLYGLAVMGQVSGSLIEGARDRGPLRVCVSTCESIHPARLNRFATLDPPLRQNFALNMASKGFSVSVCNRSHDKVRPSLSPCASRHDAQRRLGSPLRAESDGDPTGPHAWHTQQVDTTVQRAQAEGDLPLNGYKDVGAAASPCLL